MTQSPHSGPAAPRTTDLGASPDSVATPASSSAPQAQWGSTTSSQPVPADAPTNTLPAVPASAYTKAGIGTATTPGAAPPAGAPAAPAGQPRARTTRSRGPRRARLQLRHINPWTVLKFSCVLSIALFFVWLIVVGVLFGILDAAGIIGKINDTVVTLNGPGSSKPVTAGLVFGGAAIIGVINIVLFVALSTVGSVVYNLCADLVGGVEVTLSER